MDTLISLTDRCALVLRFFFAVFVFSLLLVQPDCAIAQQAVPRTKRPTSYSPSKRSPGPKSSNKSSSKDRLDARDLLSMLRYYRFDRALAHIEFLKRQGRLEEVRQAYFELWPSPKTLEKIARKLKDQPLARRRALEAWTWSRKIPRAQKKVRSKAKKLY
jgi:hypothetical protein